MFVILEEMFYLYNQILEALFLNCKTFQEFNDKVKMKDALRIHYHVMRLLVLALLLLTGCQDQQNSCIDDIASKSFLMPSSRESNDSLHETGVNDPPPPAAILQNNRLSFRIFQVRPQRLIPSQGCTYNRLTGRQPISIFKKFINLRHDGRRRQETSPFRTFASSDYYVIALRHIVR